MSNQIDPIQFNGQIIFDTAQWMQFMQVSEALSTPVKKIEDRLLITVGAVTALNNSVNCSSLIRSDRSITIGGARGGTSEEILDWLNHISFLFTSKLERLYWSYNISLSQEPSICKDRHEVIKQETEALQNRLDLFNHASLIIDILPLPKAVSQEITEYF